MISNNAPFLQNYEIVVSLIFFWQVVLSIFISTSDAFFRSHYGYPYTRPYETFSSNYGKPKPRPPLFKPIEDLDIPSLGPDGRVKWNRKSAVNLRKLAQQILASRRKLINTLTKERKMLPRLF